EAHERLQGAVREPVHGGRARLHRRRDRAERDAPEADHRAGDAADQARAGTEAQARQHPAVGGTLALGARFPQRVFAQGAKPAERASRLDGRLDRTAAPTLRWLGVAAATALAAVLFDALGLPSA